MNLVDEKELGGDSDYFKDADMDIPTAIPTKNPTSRLCRLKVPLKKSGR